MTGATLVLRSLRHHWRANLGVLLGAILATAILVGALAVGDTVRYSLRQMALARLGDTDLALAGGSRLFRAQLARDLEVNLNAPVEPLLMLPGTVVAGGGENRAGRVQVVGVANARRATMLQRHEWEGVVLNERLARRLNAKVGEELLLRIDKPSLLSRDAPLSKVEDASVAIRLPVMDVVPDSGFGRFSLEANQIPPLNAFVPIETLQRAVDQQGRANALLVGARPPGHSQVTVQEAGLALHENWTLADASLELRELPKVKQVELRTDRVFLDPPVTEAATPALPVPDRILTYFVNELRVGGRATPYSTVTAAQGSVVPADMKDDEVLINRWLADDLQAKVGDTLRLKYYVVGTQRRLTEETRSFRIREILPMQGAAADPDLMPPFPGVADAENCRDWEPGVPVDLKRIRDKDEAYWDQYRGTPKAFVTLAAGQAMWHNRFGNLTALRYPLGVQPAAAIDACIRQALKPASLGLFFVPVREQALAASSQALDFGQLFLGFSFFLIVAALLLMALLFALGIEQRAEEVGLLLALGFPPKQVQRLLLLEGGLLALIASVIGAGLGVLYTQAVVRGLTTVWKDAVADSALQFHVEPGTLAMGALIGFAVALFSIWLITRRQALAPARELLAAGTDSESGLLAGTDHTPAHGWKRWLAWLFSAKVWVVLGPAGALAMAVAAMLGKPAEAAEYFFTAGALLLIGGMAGCRLLLARVEKRETARHLTLGSLGIRNTVRRRARSLACVALLACGSFLVVSVGASRHDPHHGARERSSGTGGYAFFAEATLPIYPDLNTADGRDTYGLDPDVLKDTRVVPFRVREGDEASCLNLNRAQTPRLLGVDPAALRAAGAFSFGSLAKGADPKDPWPLLSRPEPDGAIPAVGDMNTLMWSLGKSVGDTVDYTNDAGQAIKLRIVGMMGNSVMQGNLLISEENFIREFPSRSGYQVFLVDAPPGQEEAVGKELARGLEDMGVDLTPTAERLAAFNAVENTYLSIFAVLGGLGLLLGSLGLGVVVLRNVLERRGELGLLRAIGFRPAALQWLVFSEHSVLLALGLVVGVVAALLAVLPALRSPGAEVPYGTLALTLAAVLVSGIVWTWGATALALRGPLLAALRNE